MAASTTTTLNDIFVNVIEPMFLGYLSDYRVIEPFLKEYDLRGRGSKTIQVPSLATNLGTVNDGGGSYDTEFNGTEGSDLSTTTTQSTNSVTISSAEYAVYMQITDDIEEDATPALASAVLDEIMANAAEILLHAWEDDVWALFSSLNGGTAVGSSGSDFTLANFNTAIVTLRNNGIRTNGLVAALAPIQATDFETAVLASSTATAVYDTTADRYMAITRDASNGLGNGFIASYRGVPIVMSGMADFTNTNADRVGAIFAPATMSTRFPAFGKTISRDIRMEPERDATLRGYEMVASMRWGSGELQDKAGVPVITDA